MMKFNWTYDDLDVVEVDRDISWFRTVTLEVGQMSFRYFMNNCIRRMRCNVDRVACFSSVIVRKP